MEKKNCTVYIDESGDLGINRGTRWFNLTAVIVDKENEVAARNIIKRIKNKLNFQEIHFRNIKDFSRRAYIVKELSLVDFTLFNVIIDTTQINPNLYSQKGDNPSIVLYNYACKVLLERVSWFLRDTNRIGTVCLSSRGTSRDSELISYIYRSLRVPDNNLENYFDMIYSKTPSEWDMLQLADVCATSVFYAHEVNSYDLVTPCFLRRFISKLYCYNGSYLKYGMKYLYESHCPSKEYVNEHMICK